VAEKELPVRLEDMKDRIRERIKAAFMDLIPEEKWDEIIKNEFDSLMLDQERTEDRWGHTKREAKQSELKTMVRALVKDEFAKKLKAWGEENMSAMVQTVDFDARFGELVKAAASEYIAHMGKTIVQDALRAFTAPGFNCSGCHRPAAQGAQCPHCQQWN
jgi:hypothetical protein